MSMLLVDNDFVKTFRNCDSCRELLFLFIKNRPADDPNLAKAIRIIVGDFFLQLSPDPSVNFGALWTNVAEQKSLLLRLTSIAASNFVVWRDMATIISTTNKIFLPHSCQGSQIGKKSIRPWQVKRLI